MGLIPIGFSVNVKPNCYAARIMTYIMNPCRFISEYHKTIPINGLYANWLEIGC